MSPTRSKLIAVSAQALKQVWDSHDCCLPDDRQRIHVEAVSDILQANLSNGRAQRVVGSDTPEITDTSLQRYGLRVATYYWAERERVAGLAAGDEKPWEELRQQLERRAFHMLCTRAGLPPAVAFEQARDHAQEACQRILRGRYPYDVAFDAWAIRILVNCVLKRLSRSGDLLDRGSFVELDVEYSLNMDLSSRNRGGTWQAPNPSRNLSENIANHHLLLDAIAELSSEAQRQVILLGFFYEWEDAKIAEALGKTCQAVYNLRHRALRKLREILDQHGVSGWI